MNFTADKINLLSLCGAQKCHKTVLDFYCDFYSWFKSRFKSILISWFKSSQPCCIDVLMQEFRRYAVMKIVITKIRLRWLDVALNQWHTWDPESALCCNHKHRMHITKKHVKLKIYLSYYNKMLKCNMPMPLTILLPPITMREGVASSEMVS